MQLTSLAKSGDARVRAGIARVRSHLSSVAEVCRFRILPVDDSIVVNCDDQQELDRYWNALLEGGGRPQACGWLIDRFGLRWQIVPSVLDELMRDGDAARSKNVADALLKMVKLDIATLEKAYRS